MAKSCSCHLAAGSCGLLLLQVKCFCRFLVFCIFRSCLRVCTRLGCRSLLIMYEDWVSSERYILSRDLFSGIVFWVSILFILRFLRGLQRFSVASVYGLMDSWRVILNLRAIVVQAFPALRSHSCLCFEVKYPRLNAIYSFLHHCKCSDNIHSKCVTLRIKGFLHL